MIYDIPALDATAMLNAKRRWDGIAKPLHSLGHLEDLIVRIAGIQHTPDVSLSPRCVVVLCADNGVVHEGVTQTGSHVTALVARSIVGGTASVNAMARAAHADVICADVGMLTDVDHPALLRRKSACGTSSIARGPAMTRAQALAAIDEGIRLARECAAQGYDIIATGEMGIGNTTTASAVACVLLNEDIDRMTGRGAGLTDDGLARKKAVIARAIEVNAPDPADPVDVLAKLGGYDIAAMTGVFLGGALCGRPVVIDGLISSVAALLAARIAPAALDYMIASHVSREPGGRLLLDALRLTPVIHADMALGEGTGAVSLFPLLDLALAVYRQNSTFEQIEVETYTPQN